MDQVDFKIVFGAAVPIAQNNAGSDIWDWITKSAVGAILFFLGWGLKDVKKRFDKVQDLEVVLAGVNKELEELNRRLTSLER